MKELQYLNKFFIKYKYRFLLGIVITFIAQIFSLFTPELVGDSIRSIEEYTHNNHEISIEVAQSLLGKNIILILATTLISGFFTFLMRQTLIVMSRYVEFDLKNEIYNHYQILSQTFYKQNRTGDLMSRISEDVSKVRMYVGPAVMYSMNTLVRFSMVIIYMYNISPRLTFYSLLPLPLLSYGIFKISSEINKRSGIFQANLSTLSSFAQEMFSGIRVIKAYAIEKQKEKEFTDLTEDSRKKFMNLAIVNSLFGPLMILLIGLSNLVVIYVGGMMYINGSISIGIIAQFILYINMLTWPVASLGWVSSLVQEAEASQKRINEFLHTEPEITNKTDHHFDIRGNISFENVSFIYPDTRIKALDHVSFHIKPGETLAILGKTGSGKSTLLSLISRLYDIEKGKILIDGVPIDQVNLNDLRNSISVVPQDAFLFSDSIANNIKFGNEDATEEEVIEAAKLAVVHENILHFKEGYNTVLGERGITLSGGQKQRVSIARALIKQAPILLLDDCLSAVDTETEEQILGNLGSFSQDITTIIVSHRVSSAKNASQIIILDEGRIIQQGTHNQLLAADGYYKDLYFKQLAEKEII
ncbi:ABC transporter ATP-binding protein/permease [Flavobacterium sp. NRK F10]|uniref:ABC transporter ATP-binding protein n=1 Tax=Flavobacterium sp. NRK F10 TaxID=2954931 RepID=UPI002091823E|nr:ABC transporter ATP-binding protein [Flavobacterium sp. NRK F10]MCO6176019.1 ABC transporter ATP-binding protein/permease [Flavobacterium sp. NRK F10]